MYASSHCAVAMLHWPIDLCVQQPRHSRSRSTQRISWASSALSTYGGAHFHASLLRTLSLSLPLCANVARFSFCFDFAASTQRHNSHRYTQAHTHRHARMERRKQEERAERESARERERRMGGREREREPQLVRLLFSFFCFVESAKIKNENRRTNETTARRSRYFCLAAARSVAETFSAETDDSGDAANIPRVLLENYNNKQENRQRRRLSPSSLVKLTRVKSAFLFSPQVQPQPPRATLAKCYTSQPKKKNRIKKAKNANEIRNSWK